MSFPRFLLIATISSVVALAFYYLGNPERGAPDFAQKIGDSLGFKSAAPAVPALPAETEKYSREWLEQESLRMNRVDENPTATQLSLELMATNLTLENLSQLGKTILNTAASANERILALYLLRLNIDAPAEILEKIAMLKEETIPSHLQEPLQTNLAFSALEELGLRALSQPQLVQRIKNISKKSANRAVVKASNQILIAHKKGQPFYLEMRE